MNEGAISIKKAALYTGTAKYSSVAMNIVFTMILARLLTPEQYGTVAVITVFISFFQLFADMGLGAGVIQNKTLNKNEVNDIFSFTAYLGIILMLLFLAFSYPVSIFYEDPIYIKLGALLSFSVLFSSLNIIPNAVMLKEKKFKSIAVRTIVVTFIVSCVTVVLAYIEWGVYAIVFSSVFNALGIFLWNQINVKLRFHIKPLWSSVKKIWGYSVFQFLSMIINYFCRNLDNILCGKYLSKVDLGQYNKSYTLMMMPINLVPSVINSVLHPILSDYQNDKNIIYEKFLKLLDFLSLISFFLSGLFFLAGREIILLMYGSQWVAAIIPFQLLGLSLWGQLLTNTTGTIYQSIGNTKLMFKNALVTSTIIIIAIVMGIYLGSINTLAICVSVGYMVNYFVSFFVLVKFGFGKSPIRFFMKFFPNWFLVLVPFMVYFLVSPFDSILYTFLFKLAVVFFTFCLFVVLFGKTQVIHIISQRNI